MGEALEPIGLGNGVVLRPMPWLDYDGYARLLRSADVGLSLMLSPHTGYPALELAACGASVVTSAFSTKTSERLGGISTNLIAAAPTVEGVVQGLLDARRRADDRAARLAGTELALSSNWDDVFEPLVPQVVELIDECRERRG